MFKFNETVTSLRNKGCKVKVYHLRRYLHLENGYRVIDDKGNLVVNYFPACVQDPKEALPNGGRTAVVITLPNGTKLTGWSECSNNDSYNRKRGVRIAINRALSGKVSEVEETKTQEKKETYTSRLLHSFNLLRWV